MYQNGLMHSLLGLVCGLKRYVQNKGESVDKIAWFKDYMLNTTLHPPFEDCEGDDDGCVLTFTRFMFARRDARRTRLQTSAALDGNSSRTVLL